ncbi:hypothetical protein [Dyadobacter psychrophilus]|uniref:Glycosyltransferase RgtA/B/C/D-like domain-containing protein n=1 Tax=Dyadobacter psychrophilus TaxID=651661 RepID=A0A1T5H603_9BACT|nr:hypothetical protein [Dyadobacter psychrophilus]SKC16011.1 hypothetical protein SAMN05660293_04975 [Dyadobacter psychrophilus]
MSAVLKHSRPIWLLVAMCCIATLVFFLFDAALDIPFIDDYNALLDFIIQYLRADSIEEKLHFIFRQHNEHRIVYARLVVLLDYYVFGCTNLRHLILMGSASLFLMTGIFCVEAYKSCKNILAIVPIILLSLHFQHMGSLLWATSSLQNLAVIALACVAIWLMTRSNVFINCIGIVFAFLTTFASGTGPMIWPVLFLIAITSRSMAKCLVTLLSGTASVSLYFYSYHLPTSGNTSISENLVKMPQAILGVIGGTFDIQEEGTQLIPIIAGFMVISTFNFCLGRTGLRALRRDPGSLFLVGVFLFGLLSAIAISFGRGSYVENRYKVISTLCLLATYNMVLLQLSRRHMDLCLNLISMACLSLWLVFFWRYYPEMLEYKTVRKADYLSLKNSPQDLLTPFQQRMNALEELGVKSPDNPLIQNTFLSSMQRDNVSLPSLKILKRKHKYAVKWQGDPGLPEESYLVLRSEKGSFVFPVRKELNQFSASILYDWLQKGRYTVSVYLPDQTSFISIQDTIVVDKNVKPWLSSTWFNDAYAP